ncbi:MAG: ABC transporter permease [Bryobacteraceae bacterium]
MPWWKWSKRGNREIEEELDYHLAMLARERAEEGDKPREASVFATRKLGNKTLIKEVTREMWGWTSVEQFAHDLRYGGRMLRKNPGFTIVAIVSLALGIGANSALFTAMDAVMWKLLPVQQPEQLVTITGVRPSGKQFDGIPSTFVDELRRHSVFSDVLTTSWDGLSLSIGDTAERIMGEVVSPNYFSALGIRLYLGQAFSQNRIWKPEAVVTYDFWQRRFHGNPQVIGTTIYINTCPFTIVGVAPPGFFGTEVGISPELRIPLMPPGQSLSQIDMVNGKRARVMQTIARLKRGVTIAQAEAATDAQFQHFLELSPRRIEGIELRHVHVSSAARGTSDVRKTFAKPLTILFIAVGLVLLVACSTVANLLLAKASARRREIAMRIAIGAGRGRLLRQLLTESALLSFLGGSAGLALSFWMTRALFSFLPQTHQLIVLDLQPDHRALEFTFCVAIVTGLFFGIAPALRATRGAVASALKNDSAASIGRSRTSWIDFRQFLVASQVALSLLLLIGAALLVRSLRNLKETDYGFAPEKVLLFTMKPQHEVYDGEQIRRIAAEVSRRVSELPGVVSAAWAESGPLDSRGVPVTTVSLSTGETARPLADAVTPRFFDTTGIRLLRGRDFMSSDRVGSEGVAVVDELLAKVLFHDQDPIGRTILVGRSASEQKALRVVGVARRSRYNDLHDPAEPIVYLALEQQTPYMPTLHVKTALPDGRSLIQEVRRQFEAVDRDVPVFNIKTLAARVDDSLARERLLAALSGMFGLIALLLAAIGLYGVIAYDVTRRTREIGVRMALGANRSVIAAAVLKESAFLAILGIAAGWPAAIIAARLLSSILYGVTAYDTFTGIACTAFIALVAIAAGLIPAWRASRIDPMAALRAE